MESKHSPPLAPWLILVLILFGLSFGVSLVAYSCGGLQSLDLIGGWFGTLNTLFAGLGFAVLIYTMQLQRLQMESTKVEAEDQAKLLQQTAFENSFFHLLTLHAGTIDSMQYPHATESCSGRQALHKWAVTLHKKYGRSSKTFLDKKHALGFYEEFYSIEKANENLGHYFRSFYHILNFIEASAPPNLRKMYAKILRAQLSYPELLLLAFNGLSQYGEDKLKPVMEKYAMLEQLPEGYAEMSEWFKQHYSPNAFKDE